MRVGRAERGGSCSVTNARLACRHENHSFISSFFPYFLRGTFCATPVGIATNLDSVKQRRPYVRARLTAVAVVIALVLVESLSATGWMEERDTWRLESFVESLLASSQCIIDCATTHPEGGLPYAQCVAACGNQASHDLVDGFVLGALPHLQANADGVGDDLGLLEEALAAAQSIQFVRHTASANPVAVMSSLRAFFEESWPDEGIRAHFVDAYFLAVVESIALSADPSSPWGIALHDMLLTVAHGGQLHHASPSGRTNVLSLAWALTSSEERVALQHTIESEYCDIADDIYSICRRFYVIGTPIYVNGMNISTNRVVETEHALGTHAEGTVPALGGRISAEEAE